MLIDIKSTFNVMFSYFKQSDPEGRWIEFEKCLDGYKREPYLSERSGGSTGVRIWNEQPLNVDFKRPSNSESPSEDLTIEKHVFFDMFLNRLELMNILRTAFWKTAEILEVVTWTSFRVLWIVRIISSFNNISINLLNHIRWKHFPKATNRWSFGCTIASFPPDVLSPNSCRNQKQDPNRGNGLNSHWKCGW